MPRRKVEQPALQLEPSRCEVCDEPQPDAPLIARHGGFGLRCCFRCLNMSAGELAVAYGRRLRRIAER